MNKTMPKEKLAAYRSELAELAQAARENGEALSACDETLWSMYAPASPIGRQVYGSFSDEELLDILLCAITPSGRFRAKDIYWIYMRYLEQRFRGINNAVSRAKAHARVKNARARWPADWPERVSAAPLLEKLRENGRHVSEEDRDLLKHLCEEARRTGLPPHLTGPVRRRLTALYGRGPVLALEVMGVPPLDGAELRYMKRHWEKLRAMARARRLSQKELAGYCQWLEELDQEAREPGGELSSCDSDVWLDFDPNGPTGWQIYQSFTDEELLDILCRSVGPNRIQPNYDEVYYIYQQYLQLRFHGLHNATKAVKALIRRRVADRPA